MNAILKKENVYVVIKQKEIRNEIDLKEVDSLIFEESSKNNVYLFGSRVNLCSSNNGVVLKVDGITIQEIQHNDFRYYLTPSIELDKATAFLNQMENLGVDTFIENYRNQLKELKKEIEKDIEKMEQIQSSHISDIDFIKSLKFILAELSCLIFCFFINMNAGLNNHNYMDAYNKIVNLYF